MLKKNLIILEEKNKYLKSKKNTRPPPPKKNSIKKSKHVEKCFCLNVEIQKSEKISKIFIFFTKSKIWKNIVVFFAKKRREKKIEEISDRPDLSSPPRFIIQGGSLSVAEKE